MKRNVLRISIVFIVTVTTLLLYIPTGLASTVRIGAGEVSYNTNTPPENVFKVAGSTKEFILLDSSSNSNTSKFFILTKDHYGTGVAFDTGSYLRIDPNKTTNIAYWLNHGFLTNGNGSGNLLPPDIISHIDKNHLWTQEVPGSSTTYDVTCGIVPIAQNEYRTYFTKFGVRDAIPSSSGGWWTRDSRSTSTNVLVMKVDSSIGQTHDWTANATNIYIRPVFYLDRDFFMTVRVDLTAIGANVKKAIGDTYSRDELLQIYTPDEVTNVFGKKQDLELTGINITAIGGGSLNNTLEGANSISVSAEVYHNNAVNNPLVMVISLYDENDMYLSTAIKNTNFSTSDRTKSITKDISFPAGTKPKKAMIYFWDSMSGIHTIIQSIKFPNTSL